MLLRYEVETKNPDTGLWQLTLSIRPKYRFTRHVQKHCFLCFAWTTRRWVITNETDAAQEARHRALFHARRFQRSRETRVWVRYQKPGCDHLVWKNGQFLWD